MRTISKQKKHFGWLLMLIAVFTLSFSLNSCKNKGNKTTEQEAAEAPEVNVVEVEDVWVVDEYQMNDIPLTKKITTREAPEKEETTEAKESKETEGTKAEEAGETEKEEAAEEATEHPVAPPAASDLDDALQQRGYAPTPVKLTAAVIPLDETQTAVAYTKKGKAKDALQVISSGDGSVDEVVFYHKKDKDVYNVQVGMSEKEVKKLRGDMKRMEKNGKVFLYNDNSNIMYLMKAENAEGNAVGAAKMGNLQVSAIVWKPNKSDLRKEEREMKKEEKKEDKL